MQRVERAEVRIAGLARAVGRLHEVLAGPDLAEAVAERLRPDLGASDLLADEHTVPDPSEYRQHVLHVDPRGRFSLVALVWLPGQVTPIHDHVSWCVVGVHVGGELETRYELARVAGRPALRRRGQWFNAPGSVMALQPPGDIHRVANAGRGTAISIHVYGADIGRLGSSIRRRYDLPVVG